MPGIPDQLIGQDLWDSREDREQYCVKRLFVTVWLLHEELGITLQIILQTNEYCPQTCKITQF